jgi:hypothetical protein
MKNYVDFIPNHGFDKKQKVCKSRKNLIKYYILVAKKTEQIII